MRAVLIIVALCSLLGVAFVVQAEVPRSPRPCTQEGGPGTDVLHGTQEVDVLCGHRGDDFLHGDGGNDILRAGRDKDTAVGAKGRDILRGGRGPDRLFGVDDRGGDVLVGGAGKDECFADRGDQVSQCETIYRGLRVQAVSGLERLALQVMVIATEGIPPPPPVPTPEPVTVTVTETITTTVPFPPCSPPPEDPPTPC